LVRVARSAGVAHLDALEVSACSPQGVDGLLRSQITIVEALDARSYRDQTTGVRDPALRRHTMGL
jgi:hypothetical protein